MALLTRQQASLAGTVITYSAADAAGDTFRPDDHLELRVRNGSAGAITVTIVTPGNTKYGQAEPDIPVSVAAGAEVAIGPFPTGLADPTDRLVDVTYSAAASVTVALVGV
jgi:hypothetical protein